MSEILWCCHLRGPDEVFGAPDYETALKWADIANALDWRGHAPTSFDDCLIRAVPALWPWSAEQHAESIPKSIDAFTPRNEASP